MLYYALVFLVVSLIADALNLAGVSTVAAAECPATDLRDGGTIQGMPTWKATTLSILPLTLTVERDIYGELVPSPVLGVAPYMKSSRIVLGKTEKHRCLFEPVYSQERTLQSRHFQIHRQEPGHRSQPVHECSSSPLQWEETRPHDTNDSAGHRHLYAL